MADDPVRPDAPNQQVVRPDGSHPADEGDGAGKAKKTAAKTTAKAKTGDTPPEPEAA